MKRGGGLHPARHDCWPPTKQPPATPAGLIAAGVTCLSRREGVPLCLRTCPPLGRTLEVHRTSWHIPFPRHACMFLVLGFRGAWVSHAPPRVPKQRRPSDAALPPVSGSRLAGSPAWHGLPQCPGCGHWVSYCWFVFVFASWLRLGVGFVDPCQSWPGSWVGVFRHGLWCCPSFASCLWCSWLGLGFGLFTGRVWFRARFACPPPFPVLVCAVGVRAGPGSPLCPALLGWVVEVCFLRFFLFFSLLCGVGCWGPCPRPCGLSPHPLSSGLGRWLFFFFVVCVCMFRCPFSRWAAVPGLVLPVLAWRSPCASLGVPSSVPSGWGVWPPFVLLAGGFCGFERLTPPPPPLPFFLLGGGGGGATCSSFCLPWAGARTVAGVWCGWSLATPGGGSCVLLPATPSWVSLPVVVGVPRHSWLRVPGAVPRHSWLGSAGGGGVWCAVCGVRRWCVGGVVAGVWCGWSLATPGGGSCVLLPATPGLVSLPVVLGVPRHSWRRVPGAVPRHSWLGFAVGGGVWCVVCAEGAVTKGQKAGMSTHGYR